MNYYKPNETDVHLESQPLNDFEHDFDNKEAVSYTKILICLIFVFIMFGLGALALIMIGILRI
jgi:fatty acid desaturase